MKYLIAVVPVLLSCAQALAWSEVVQLSCSEAPVIVGGVPYSRVSGEGTIDFYGGTYRFTISKRILPPFRDPSAEYTRTDTYPLKKIHTSVPFPPGCVRDCTASHMDVAITLLTPADDPSEYKEAIHLDRMPPDFPAVLPSVPVPVRWAWSYVYNNCDRGPCWSEVNGGMEMTCTLR